MKHQDGAVPLSPLVAQRSAVIADGHEPPAAQDLTVPAADLPSSEAFWRERLQAFRLLSLPFRLRAAAAEPEWQVSPWQEVESLTPASPDERLISLLSVYAVYLVRLTGETTFQLGWAVRPQKASELLAPVVPMEVFADLERPFREVQDYFAAEHALLAQHQSCARDLMEQCSVPSAGGLPWALGISLVEQRAGTNTSANAPLQDSVSGELLTLQLDFQAVAAFRWLYDAARLDADQVARMSQHILELAASAAAAFAPAGRLNLLPAAERELLLETWNRTGMEFPENLCVHQLFEKQVERAPQAHAVVFEQETLTYSVLNDQANRLAHRLVELGVGPDQRVAVCLERSPAFAVSLLAVLKAGGAYVPMDTAYPAERLAYILSDSQPAVLLADQAGRQALGDSAPPALPVLDPNLPLTGPEHNPQRTDLAPNHLAYIIYTSGSTGTPKGVMVEHRHLNNLIHWHLRDFSVQAGTRSTATAGLAFDASAWELWPALSSGGTLLLPPRAVARDIAQMLDWWTRQPLDISFLVTPLAAMVLREQAIGRTLRCLLIGGDQLDRMPSVLPENLSLINNYGPTETTVVATSGRLHPGDPTIHIGRPIANTRLYVLDTYGQPVPLGAVGELYIGGAGVARGYLNRPELTAERFLEDPFCGVPGERMYRTGDLVRYRPDGNLEFLGRNDDQVKIRGFRIELGEIEARLLEHPAIREAVVLAREEAAGEKRLVAYITSEQETPELAATLRTHVGAALPEYMVPAAFVRLEEFPLTPNGKLDRKALPAPPAEAYAREAYEPPQGSMETALAAIWAELLQVERVGRNDHFFALGGHSLLAVRMMSRIAALGVDVPLSALFAAPTLKAFAEAVDQRLSLGAVALPDITPAPRDEALPLSFAQQRLWFLAQLEQRSDNYHIPLALRLRGPLDVAALGGALNQLWARHEALRTVFVLEEGRPVVRLLASQLGLPLPQDDLRGLAEARAQLDRLSRQEAYAPFDLEHGPLIRARLIRLADAEYILLLTQHHIVADGWSMGILVHELSALYSGRALPALEVQYPDFAVWQRRWLAGERLETQSAYWRSALADAPVFLPLPADRPRPARQTFAGAHLPVRLDAELTSKLKRLSRQHSGTLFMTLMAAWAAVLSRLSGQQELVVGTATANRRHRQIEGLIGFFVNALALRIDLSHEPTAAQLLAQVRQRVLAAQEHQDLPFEQVVEIVQPPRSMDHTPLFQVMFVWQNNELGEWRLPGVEVETVQVGYDIVRFDVELSLSEVGDEIAGTLSYATALFDRQTMERHLGYLRAMLEALAADPAQTVTEIDLLSAPERKLLLETWNATEAAYPEQACIHQLFEQQVERTPDAIALVFGQETLTYAELSRQANRLAHYLRELGVAPDQRVAICVERSAAMVVGILAILKAGGAYVPLDPSYPAERLAYMLRDSAPVALLTESRTQPRLASVDGIPHLLLEAPEQAWQAHPEHDLDARSLGLTPAHLAYVIYTSGSTGIPKGVLVEHRNVVRLVCNTNYAHLAPDDVIAQASNVSFDAATFEIWGALLNGCRLTGISRFDLLTLGEHFKSLNVTVLFLTTALFQECVRTDPRVFEGIGQLFFGGEACDPVIVHRAREAFGPRKLVHVYGPTETTTFASSFPVPAKEEPTVPIGRPIANTRLYILDQHRHPVPLGAPGELYVGGTGVARGYLHQPGLTAERFVEDPFNSVPGSRMYRTGDLARFRADGNVEFLGRNDDQVKIRGFRIELGEIEARLQEHAAVREAVVMARQDTPQGKSAWWPTLPLHLLPIPPSWLGCCELTSAPSCRTTWCPRPLSASRAFPLRPTASSIARRSRRPMRRRLPGRPMSRRRANWKPSWRCFGRSCSRSIA
jgi:amino acid adenylation domain-containing protein